MRRTAAGSGSGGVFPPVERFFQFCLLGMLASGLLALVGSGHLDAPTTLAAAAAIGARALLVAGVARFRVSEGWVTALTIAYAGFYPLDYLFFSEQFLAATVHLVVFLAVVKIVTARTDRDYFLVVVTALLEILAASLLSARLNYFVFLALFLAFAVAALAGWEIRRSAGAAPVVARAGRRNLPWRLTSLAALTAVGILAFTAGLFFVLPRTAQAAFQRLLPEDLHVTAFSDQVRLGEIGEVKQQGTVLLHVRIPGVSGALQLKWRGTGLGEFDGRRWYNAAQEARPLRVRNSLLQVADDEQRRRPGRRLNYEVRSRSFASGTLFIAGLPEFIRIDSPLVMRTATGAYRAGYGTAKILRYGVYSYVEGAEADLSYRAPPLTAAERRRYLRLPTLDPRIARLARRWTAASANQWVQARAIERHLRTEYRYTIQLPETEAADPIAQFLFERREGHCEYFASAMAVMLRTLGIPSRVATGFQGGVYNPLSGWYLVRASDAHSWVEAYLPRRGWTTFDPTPPDSTPAGAGWRSQLGLLVDAAETFWQEWVLSYDLDRQLTLAARLEHSGRRVSFGWFDGASAEWDRLKARAWETLRGSGRAAGLVLAGLILAALAAPRARKWWSVRRRIRRVQRGEAAGPDAAILYGRALELLARRGFEKPAWLTPAEFARGLPASPMARLFTQLTGTYNELRFGGRREAAPRLLALLEQMEHPAEPR